MIRQMSETIMLVWDPGQQIYGEQGSLGEQPAGVDQDSSYGPVFFWMVHRLLICLSQLENGPRRLTPPPVSSS